VNNGGEQLEIISSASKEFIFDDAANLGMRRWQSTRDIGFGNLPLKGGFNLQILNHVFQLVVGFIALSFGGLNIFSERI